MKSIKGKGLNCSGSSQLTTHCSMNRFWGSFPKQRFYQISDYQSGKTKRIVHDKENGILCDSQESANTPDYGMIASFWVLLDFKKAIVYHTDGEFPIKLNFFSKDEWYEVLYVPQEQEYLINHVMESQPKNDAKRLVVLEKEEQAAKLHIKGVIAFCLVDSTTGSVSYYAKKWGMYEHQNCF